MASQYRIRQSRRLRTMRHHLFIAIICLAYYASTNSNTRCAAFVHPPPTNFPQRTSICSYHSIRVPTIQMKAGEEPMQEDSRENVSPTSLSMPMDRRSAMLTAASAALILPLVAKAARASASATPKSLEDLALGDGVWKQVSTNPSLLDTNTQPSVVPAFFATYMARFLINYDDGVASWWKQKTAAVSMLPEDQKLAKLGKAFASLARSMQMALDQFLQQQQQQPRRESYALLLQMFQTSYDNDKRDRPDVRRQIGLLFSMLPPKDQPSFSAMTQFVTTKRSPVNAPDTPVREDFVDDVDSYQSNLSRFLARDLSAMLPSGYRVAAVKDSDAHTIYPTVSLFEVGFQEEFGQTAIATPFGPLSSTPLVRDKPDYTPSIYALFGISGATGCALTHSIVIPLDVVKTRAQTDPGEFSDLFKGAGKIVQQEGIQGLLLGAQATLAGYFWYGLSVYPSYAFFKRWFTQAALPPEVAMVHANDIALVAGACAAVIASLGLTPLEAARIRVVAEPDKYRPLGLSGTLKTIAEEDMDLGWKGLYAGLPSLLTRQVIFGSIKFLAFERASEAIFAAAPQLRDATWTSLAVSLVAGGLSGAISSVVSQPADSVLTYVAQNSRGTSSMGVVEGAFIMIEEEGAGSLFRGLGSRCVWAGSIIAGQFLLYDVFRTIFSVSSEDLSQVYQVVLPQAQII